MLGLLLQPSFTKYGLLETLVASRLKPQDWLARRDLAAGLAQVRLDDAAVRELTAMQRLKPDWSNDPSARHVDSLLTRRRPAESGVAVFGPGGLR